MNIKEILLVVGVLAVGLLVGRLSIPAVGGVYNSPTGVSSIVDTTSVTTGVISYGSDILEITGSGATTTLTAAQVCNNRVISYTPDDVATATLKFPSTANLIADCLTTVGDSRWMSIVNTATATSTIISSVTEEMVVGMMADPSEGLLDGISRVEVVREGDAYGDSEDLVVFYSYVPQD